MRCFYSECTVNSIVSIHHTVYSEYIVYSLHCKYALYSKYTYKVYSIQYTVYSIQYTVYNIQYTVYSIVLQVPARVTRTASTHLAVSASARQMSSTHPHSVMSLWSQGAKYSVVM